jgi:hypothetical protein
LRLFLAFLARLCGLVFELLVCGCQVLDGFELSANILDQAAIFLLQLRTRQLEASDRFFGFGREIGVVGLFFRHFSYSLFLRFGFYTKRRNLALLLFDGVCLVADSSIFNLELVSANLRLPRLSLKLRTHFHKLLVFLS